MEIKNMFKIVTIGNSGCGKTSLLTKFLFNNCDQICSTIGVEFFTRKVEYSDGIYSLQFWDTAGQEKYNSISKSIVNGAKCVLFVYDITNIHSFENIVFWKNYIEKMPHRNAVYYLIGNKNDLSEKREINKEIGYEFASKNNMIFFETNIYDGENINKVFHFIIENLISKFKNENLLRNSPEMKKFVKNRVSLSKNEPYEKEKKCSC